MDDKLNKFRVLIDAGSFTAAALQLGISQPALSVAIRKLEARLGNQLVVRAEDGLWLTEAGKVVYEAAMQEAVVAKNLQTSLLLLNNERVTIRLGSIDSIASMIAANRNLMNGLQASTATSFFVHASGLLEQQVSQHDLEGAFVTAIENLGPRCNSLELEPEVLLAVCSPDQLETAERHLSKGKIPNFIGYNVGSRSQQLIGSSLKKMNITAEPSYVSTSPEVMLGLALSGQGAAILPFSLVKKHLDQQQLVTIRREGDVLRVSRPIFFIYPRGLSLLPSISQTVLEVEKMLKEQKKEVELIINSNT